MNLVDPLSVVAKMPPGLGIYGVTHRPETHLDFYFREESKIIKIMRNSTVEFHGVVFDYDNVYLVCVMALVDRNLNQLFETWWNYHQDGNSGASAFQKMATQENFAIHWVGDSGTVEKSSKFKNSLALFFTQALETMNRATPWSMAQFDGAREKLYREYPDGRALWQEMG